MASAPNSALLLLPRARQKEAAQILSQHLRCINSYRTTEMSNAKKNKGRDPAALFNDSPTTRLVQKFLEMSEVDYTRNVVIPSLEAEGYERIDFHHGATEIGKDLIFSKTMGYGRKLLVVAVIKSDKLSKSSSDSSGFPVFRIQLQQAIENEVTTWDGTKRRPDRVIVIFADDPSSDILGSSPGGFQDCITRGVEFISGSEIADSLINHRKDIAEQLLETKLDVTEFLSIYPTNLPLLHALHNNDLIDIKTIFTDLDASVGTTTIAKALSLEISAESSLIFVEENAWQEVSKIIRDMEAVYGKFLSMSLDHSERKFNDINKLAKSKKNIKLLEKIINSAIEIQRWAASVRTDISKSSEALNSYLLKKPQARYLLGGNIKDVDGVLSEIKDAVDNLSNAAKQVQNISNATKQAQNKGDIKKDVNKVCIILNKTFDFILAAQKNIPDIHENGPAEAHLYLIFTALRSWLDLECRNAKGFKEIGEKMLKHSEQVILASPYELEFESNRMLFQIKEQLNTLVLRFQSDQVAVCRDYSKQLLEDTRRYLSVLELFLTNGNLSSVLAPSAHESADVVGLNACILGLLGSGVDTLIIGNAGSGKSTTLEMFARRRFETRHKDEEVIFLPMVKLPASVASDARDPLVIFCDEIAKLFRLAQPGVTQKFVMDRIIAARSLVFVFDGIDEASNLTGWLLQLITAIRSLKGGNAQIVVSSRFGVSELEKLGLIQIQLLPFRPEQVKRFVRDFLYNEPALSENIIEHLHRRPAMFSVAQTPMMSTILCILAKNGVILPETKNALYKERFELLWGAYDAKKQVLRVKSTRSCLEDVSKKAAYYLHTKRIRSAVREEISSYIQDALSRKYRLEFVLNALQELERPCNILVEEADGKVGFGHLSYQEYLVSEELYSNRQGDIVAHLSDPWWREALVLTAMKTEDIGTIIEDRVMQMGFIGNAADTLNAMISVCNPRQQEILRTLLRKQSSLDYMTDD